MSTLAVVEEILRETGVPMSVRQIVEHARGRLPTRSKTPDTVVARDLSMDIKKKGDSSLFLRTEPGRYTLRSLRAQQGSADAEVSVAVKPASAMDPMGPDRLNVSPVQDQEPALEPHSMIDCAQPMSITSAAIRDERAGTLPARVPSTSSETKRDSTK